MAYPNEDCGCGCNTKSCENFNVEIVRQLQTHTEQLNNIFTFKVNILFGNPVFDITWLTNSDAYLPIGNIKQNIIKVQLNPDLTDLDKNDLFLKVIVIDSNNCIAKDTWTMKNYSEVETCPCCNMKVSLLADGYSTPTKAYQYRAEITDSVKSPFTYKWSFASEHSQYEFVSGDTTQVVQVRLKNSSLTDTVFIPYMLKLEVSDSDGCFAKDFYYQSVDYWNSYYHKNKWDYFYNRS